MQCFRYYNIGSLKQKKRIKELEQQLIETMKQHEVVNSQHSVLGELVEKMKKKVDNVNNIGTKNA